MTDSPPPKRASAWDNHLVPLIPIVLALLVAVAAHLYARGHPLFLPHDHQSNHPASHRASSPALGLRVGAHAPLFSLQDAQGHTVSLQDRLQRGPVLIVFYLGYSCTRCVQHLRSIEDDYPAFAAAGAQILAISPDPATFSAQRQREFGSFPYPLLSDPDRKVATSFSVYRGEGQDYHGVFLLDRAGIIRFAYSGDHPYEDVNSLIQTVRQQR